MPLYDFECSMCNCKQEDVFVHNRDDIVICSECGGETIRAFPTRFNAYVFPADGIFLEHVCPEGMRFFSVKEMKDYAKQNNLELGALD